MENCLICQRLDSYQKGQRDFVIHEFDRSFFVVGEHQFYPGYAVLYFKDHAREMTDLSLEDQAKVFQELMLAGKAMQKALQPFKLNYACLGNQVEHIHWHIFPRYQQDPHFKEHPWFQSSQFPQFATTRDMARDLAENICKFL